jgi:HD-GYP domain-containing protein (c-di-GMP phosphodiesterase class II)
MSSFDVIPIKLRTLPLEFYLESKVYHKNPTKSDDSAANSVSTEQSDYIVLCENQILTQALLDRLKKAVFPSNTIYIHREYVVDCLFNRGHFFDYSMEDVQAIRGGENPWDVSKIPDTLPITRLVLNLENTSERYEETKKVTDDLIKTAAKTGKIDKEQSEEIADGVLTQVNEVDASLIIRSINRIRTVDEYLHTHSLNVAYLNGLMGKWMEFDTERQSELVEVGLLHDIGKLRLDQEILNKPAKLTAEEFEEVKKHPALSLDTLTNSGVKNRTILDGVAQHHEKVNGRGYPYGLDTKKICEFARITAISDIYDAMVTKRVYKDPHSPFVILNEFAAEGYSELDIKYVNVFIDCMIDELKGKEIIMNDGSVGKVLLVNPRRLLYPMVEINGKAYTTDDNLYCTRMKDALDD